MNKIKVMSIFGTRPEAIKMAPLVKELEKNKEISSVVCVTAQHREMLDQVLEIFHITPDYDLDIMQKRQTLAGITTKALGGLESIIAQEMPHIILVHGDTSTTFAGALAGYYNQVPVGHVEAGLRTYDKYQPFPEEMNRRLTGALAELHFAPTPLAKQHLQKENVDDKNIYITGNTVIDALAHTIEENYKFSIEELNQIDFHKNRVIAMTAHRRENLGQPLEHICYGVKQLVEEFSDIEVVYPVHKNPVVMETVYRILGDIPRVHLIEPLDLKDMHNLMYRSFLVMTDSGGLQEEVPSMGKPVLVLRNVTERPEGVEAGTLKLVGTNQEKIYQTAKELLTNPKVYKAMAQAKNPFGDGEASRRIVENILFYFGKNESPAEEYNTDEIKKTRKTEETMHMKDERLAIIGLLEKGVINVQETKELLETLQNTSGVDTQRMKKTVSETIEKAGAVFGTAAKNVGEQAEKMQPVVKDITNKVAEKAENVEPIIRSAAFRMTEMMEGLKEDIKDGKFSKNSKIKPKKNNETTNVPDEEEIIEVVDEEIREDVSLEEQEDMEVEEILSKNMDSVLTNLQSQLDQINDAESFLKATFGDMEDIDWEDDEVDDTKEESKKEI